MPSCASRSAADHTSTEEIRVMAFRCHSNIAQTGATGLESATSGVTAVRTPFGRVSSSRRNRVTVRLFRVRPYRPRTNGKTERFIRTMLGGYVSTFAHASRVSCRSARKSLAGRRSGKHALERRAIRWLAVCR